MKNALKLILSLVSVLVLVVLAAVYFWPTSDSGEFVSSPLDYISDKIVSDELTVESCEGLPDSDVCFLKLAKQSGDASFCKRIKGHNYYYACAEKIWESDGCVYAALVGDSLDACTFVPAVPSNYHDCRDEDDVHECEDFMFKRVIDSDDLSACGDSQKCELSYDIVSNDLTDCGEFTDSMTLMLCNSYMWSLGERESCDPDECLFYDLSEQGDYCGTNSNTLPCILYSKSLNRQCDFVPSSYEFYFDSAFEMGCKVAGYSSFGYENPCSDYLGFEKSLCMFFTSEQDKFPCEDVVDFSTEDPFCSDDSSFLGKISSVFPPYALKIMMSNEKIRKNLYVYYLEKFSYSN